MRNLILQAIADIPNKEHDDGRYFPVKKHLYLHFHPTTLGSAVKDKTIRANYNLDKFDYAAITDDAVLLEIYNHFVRRQFTQR